MQNEIVKKTKLLDQNGNLVEPGFAKTMLYDYNKGNIKANPLALKEWDFYQMIIGDYVLVMTIANISYAAQVAAELVNVQTKERWSFSRLKLLPLKRIQLPLSPEEPSNIEIMGEDYRMRFVVESNERRLTLEATDKKLGRLSIDIRLNNDKNNEKMVIATPFSQKHRFYLNCKENYFGGTGKIRIGDKSLTFDATHTALLDWGRGVWPFSSEWFWGNGSAILDGNKFGFNLGWGFGDLGRATENMLFWNGRAHKLGMLDVSVDVNDYMKPWKFRDREGRLNLTLVPIHDKVTDTRFAFLRLYCHQLFGYYSGFVTLDDGQRIKIDNLLAFCEHARNRW